MRDAAGEGVAVGFFDGVHLGHQAILRGAATAVTFRNHPLAVLDPERAPRLIMSFEDRLAAIRACGVNEVIALDFTEELAAESPETFMARLGPYVRCGENWRFGARGAGDAAFLRARGIAVDVVPYAVHAGSRISSTRIRTALESGEISDANAMLGRSFVATGAVFSGKGEGRKLGFPTVNLRLETMIRLPLGVYEVEVGGRQAIANYGVAPTLGARAWPDPRLEVHFLAGEGVAASDSRLRISFRRFLRPERKFESARDLVSQIEADIRSLKGGL